ncbi:MULTISPECIES: hypothetical protein [Rhodococcus]|uniref:hypothetical protein n=1 Tax=Rhodococcus TaxID=1827 RepID=UPI0003159F50|nr:MULTISPECIES: hypothetical protein [Rhodococcus]
MFVAMGLALGIFAYWILSAITTQVYLVVHGLMFPLRTPSWKQDLAADPLAGEA